MVVIQERNGYRDSNKIVFFLLFLSSPSLCSLNAALDSSYVEYVTVTILCFNSCCYEIQCFMFIIYKPKARLQLNIFELGSFYEMVTEARDMELSHWQGLC